ncbi:alpha/beta hydrolase [Amycolatopsis minnesotensis]|uniref:Alpha/beta hydrolase n=1 Tax=Amycolatopsis minnesotensis TaxID=337894 RepID=A0ABP5CL12_9PSEU
MSRVAGVFLTVLAIAAVCVQPVSAAPRRGLDWRACGDGMECAKLVVPVDWADPTGPKTTVDLAKLPARVPATKVGDLVVNTGGPSTTIQSVRAQPAVLTQLTTWFDMILIDPRGFGDKDSATPNPCGPPAPHIFGLTQATDERAWNAYAERNAAYDRGCREAGGDTYRGYTSWQIAHDLESLRVALGDAKLRYFGNSYGTVYGQAYAELFGSRIDRMYLEGVADHTQPRLIDWLANYARTDEQQLDRFAEWCAQRVNCFLHDDGVGPVYDELLNRVRRAPLPAPGAGAGSTVDADMLVATVREGLNVPYWPKLAQALAEAKNGDAGRLLTDPALHPRDDPPGAPSSPSRASLCHDFMPVVPGYAEFRGIETVLKRLAPRVGWMQGRYELGRCLGIGSGPAYPPHPLRATGVPPVLVGVGDLDNNTNRLGADHVAHQFPGGRILRNGDGHAAYLLLGGRREDSCLRTTVNRYLVEGTLPERGTHCPAEIVPTIPDRP